MPTFLILLGYFLAVHEGLHAVVVQGIWLYEVYDVEFIAVVFLSVTYPEVEPLRHVLHASVVLLQFKIVLEFVDLGCPMKVARFKSRFKYECVVVLSLDVVVYGQLVKIPAVNDLTVGIA
jgi:hypothetical protein